MTERKKGLAEWLKNLLGTILFSDNKDLFDFFASDSQNEEQPDINLEDALPSTLTRAAAVKLIEHLEPIYSTPVLNAPEPLTTPDAAAAAAAITTPIAASYYPYWAAGRVPPEGLDYSRWDILYYGSYFPCPHFPYSCLTWW